MNIEDIKIDKGEEFTTKDFKFTIRTYLEPFYYSIGDGEEIK